MHKSILRQLPQYQEPTQPPTTEVPQSPNEVLLNNLRDVLERLCEVQGSAREKKIKQALHALADFEPSPEIGVLYPIELAVLYHMAYRHQFIFCSEAKTDSVTWAFLRKQDMPNYLAALRDNLDKPSITIFLARVLQATWGGPRKMDCLPLNYRQLAADCLRCSASPKTASDILERLKTANVGQLILGRITYLAFWQWQQIAADTNAETYLTDYRRLLSHNANNQPREDLGQRED